MSLSNALSNAVSGIVAASRGTEVVASNLSNALTPGYARRELQLSTRPYIAAGGGVSVTEEAENGSVTGPTLMGLADEVVSGTRTTESAIAEARAAIAGATGTAPAVTP